MFCFSRGRTRKWRLRDQRSEAPEPAGRRRVAPGAAQASEATYGTVVGPPRNGRFSFWFPSENEEGGTQLKTVFFVEINDVPIWVRLEARNFFRLAEKETKRASFHFWPPPHVLRTHQACSTMFLQHHREDKEPAKGAIAIMPNRLCTLAHVESWWITGVAVARPGEMFAISPIQQPVCFHPKPVKNGRLSCWAPNTAGLEPRCPQSRARRQIHLIREAGADCRPAVSLEQTSLAALVFCPVGLPALCLLTSKQLTVCLGFVPCVLLGGFQGNQRENAVVSMAIGCSTFC